MINNFTEWASNNDAAIATGDGSNIMGKLTLEQKNVIADLYSDFAYFMNAPLGLINEKVVCAEVVKVEFEQFPAALKELREKQFAPYMIFNRPTVSGGPQSVIIRGAIVPSI